MTSFLISVAAVSAFAGSGSTSPSGGTIVLPQMTAECNASDRLAGDDLACQCMIMAVEAANASGGFSSANYSSWNAAGSWEITDGHGTVVRSYSLAAPTTGGSLAGSCFDLKNNIDTTDADVASAFTEHLGRIAGNYADAYAGNSSWHLDYGVTAYTYRSGSSSMRYDKVDTEFGTWSESKTTSGPIFEELFILNLLPIGQDEYEMQDAQGNSMGTIRTEGHQPIGAFLVDREFNGELQAEIFYADGTHTITQMVGPNTEHFFGYHGDLSTVQTQGF
jgi:hypothetical protein